jgi:DNA-binding transcriptional MerR regulator
MGVNKSKSAFRSIAEVTEDLKIAPHVLRFWETKFSQIKPMKTKSSRRYYRPDDVAILELIKELLYVRRYTIEGVQKLFKNRTVKDILGTEIQKDFFEDIDDNTDTNTQVSNTAMQDAINSAIISLSQIKEDLKNIVSL